ncbi:MAG: SUMF1/EgtB/PvdO family nonheme iron enzyme [Planctomycetes bacterium]|nr:SUMF1/EgtB/PvdO family nonheme iron enzyme [Planctomycetota bacterium]
MSSSGEPVTRPLPGLTAAVHDELLEILFGDPAARQARLQALRARAAGEVAAIDAHVDSYERCRNSETAGCPEVLGYRIHRRLGEGGMGVVYDAEQLAPLRRRVAIKVIKAQLPSGELGVRFELERQALARMEHEAIARVFDCGSTTAGQPFFAMEFVDGLPIDRYADERRLTVQARIRLLLQVCRGVQHAHQKGIVHRDIKPSNVLVGERDGEALAKLIDFGVAGLVEQPHEQRQTQVGQLLGTPEYMSPEQADGEAGQTDTRSDVYSLGALAYELLSGFLPFASTDGTAPSWQELRERQRADRLTTPSQRLDRFGNREAIAAANRCTSVTGLRRALAGDLDWILLRAMEHDPERRYPSAIALADDLQRHLDGLPVTASPPTTWYRLRKFVRRYRGPLVAAMAVLVAIVTGLVGTGLALLRARMERARYDLLANVVMLRDARTQAERIGPDGAGTREALAAWQREFAVPLLAALPSVREAAAGAWDPGDRSAAYLHEALVGLVPQLEAFASREVPMLQARQAWAERLAGLQSSERWRAAWQRAREAIRAADGVVASRRYSEVPIDLLPQDGLWPLGMNQATGLWEFYDLRSAVDLLHAAEPAAVPLPVLQPTGGVEVDGEAGIVFVLLPGGKFRFGAQREDPAAANFDPDMPAGGRTVEVSLAPFLIGRHELTQGQWRRLGGPACAYYASGTRWPGMDDAVSDAHPIEQVTEAEGEAVLARQGLLLPTEAQWEYACRAGSSTPWNCGAGVETLRGHANLLDQAAKQRVPNWPGDPVSWVDDFVIHGRVGQFPASAFGLFDMHGNVAEWCRDGSAGSQVFGDGDGVQIAAEDGKRVFRGGSFQTSAIQARCAWRFPMTRDWRSHDTGLRAVRRLSSH